ncbi:hypothetical protein GCM10011348_40690 [Marinobacterium nitratireducens]|uniref:DUF2845 domain-containing protein n=1 Tax=Marinobacterium nitratireducens TaxID=518897 RepID=A0A917ZNY2_9GAMM|nr:hypothetical protein [Marinobacterium nitratireducens]GGO87456.1 hypothetical protein GCM10011348_40690 [Marinobacterium nitratireducens]
MRRFSLLIAMLLSLPAAADQIRIDGHLFRDGDSVVKLLNEVGPPLLISIIDSRCLDRYCRYTSPAEQWTYLDDGKEIRIIVIEDTIDAIEWKFEQHSW